MLNIIVRAKTNVLQILCDSDPHLLLLHDWQAMTHSIKPGSTLPGGGSILAETRSIDVLRCESVR